MVEHGPHVGRLNRQEVVRTGHADPARQRFNAQTLHRQPAAVGCQHRGVVGACAVPGNEQARVAIALPIQPPSGEGRGGGTVKQEVRIAHLGIQPVVSNHCDRPSRGQRFANERVILAVALSPRSAVEENNRPGRPFHRANRPVDVQPLPRMCAVGQAKRRHTCVGRRHGVENIQGRTPCQARQRGCHPCSTGHATHRHPPCGTKAGRTRRWRSVPPMLDGIRIKWKRIQFQVKARRSTVYARFRRLDALS